MLSSGAGSSLQDNRELSTLSSPLLLSWSQELSLLECSTTGKIILDFWVKLDRQKYTLTPKHKLLECEGRSLDFYYDKTDFYKSTVALKRDNNLPASNPLKISMILLFGPGAVLPIIGYMVIFWYESIQIFQQSYLSNLKGPS